MTLLARKALSDCRLALRLLEDEAQEDVWRVHWAGALALVGVINDILERHKKTSPIGKVYRKKFDEWKIKADPSHSIFRDFIKGERNLLLHEYKTNVDVRKEVEIYLVDERPAYFPSNESEQAPASSEVFMLDQNIFRPMQSGDWRGEDARDVYETALNWWEKQLDEIDAEVVLLCGLQPS